VPIPEIEQLLQLLALFGGWPGALLAQQYLRHKSNKKPFLWVFWCCVILNFAVLIGVVWQPAGLRLMHQLG
jgi:uncharacterized membrane protein YsdA (DUF1294 family)